MSSNEKNPKARQLAGQLVMIRLPGTALDADAAGFLRDNGIRAVCLFRQNMVDSAQLTKLVADLRAAMGPKALIALDQEGGAVVRATWLPAAPSGMALGAADDAALAYAVGAAVARGVKSLGFNWNFAPVLDINNNPNNPVIAERSFGAEPKRAAELALAWMEGSLSEGVACCVKHFPGHGDTHVDSHRALPVVDKSQEILEQQELAPFRQAADKAPAMMTAHIVYPTLDSEYPATLSRRILTDLLRDSLNYRGVVITDGMDMQAIAGRYGVGNAAVLALEAGADMVMELGTRATQLQTLEALSEAIGAGHFAQDELDAHLSRLDKLASTYPSLCCTYEFDAEDRKLMADAWRRSLTAYRNPARPAPGAKVRLVARADVFGDGVTEAGIPAVDVAAMLRRFYDVDLVTFTDAESFDWKSLPADGRMVILASTSRLRYGEHARHHWRPDLHLALWSPFQALDIAAPALLTYGFAQPALEAVADWLTGKIEAGGKCPVAGFDD
ncbi:MAG: beta-N-acetylhexosaminidase [Burkholderiales bacterium]